MAFLLDKTALSALRLRSQKADDSLMLSRRGFHVEPGAREKALLAEDSSLKRFKSHKKSLRSLKMVGDVLTIVVVAGMLIFSPKIELSDSQVICKVARASRDSFATGQRKYIRTLAGSSAIKTAADLFC
ncbi:UNVERIFIED_CONTAM: Succinate dehydrogenase subunitB, mitochondrial [Sesamum calycinum]|uniref:Succinate dehydrogenase subunitB, mitochondrial n=1 Tax=Sesamum calycinum TaxID=2727403 RepID=A0AAW2NG83_9LAMI